MEHALESTTRAGRGVRPRAIRLSLEVLEDRTTPSTFLVTNALDPRGALVRGSLRWAVAQANLPRNQGSTVAITPAVPGAITLRAGEIRYPLEHDDRERVGTPVDDSTAIPELAGLPDRQQPANDRGDHHRAERRQHSDPDRRPRAQRKRRGHPRRQPAERSDLAYVNVVGNSADSGEPPSARYKGNGGGIYSSGTVTLDHTSVSANSANGPNSASGHAGGVYTDQGVTLIASQVDSNTARNAAGILNVFGSVEVLDGSTVNNNSSYGNSFNTGDLGGGGIGEMAGNVIDLRQPGEQ